MGMTVQELIDELNKVQDKSKPVEIRELMDRNNSVTTIIQGENYPVVLITNM